MVLVELLPFMMMMKQKYREGKSKGKWKSVGI